MNPQSDLELIKGTYARMSDDELVHISTTDAKGFTPEAQEIVQSELQKRGLGNHIVEGMKAQNKPLTGDAFDALCALARNLECPCCGSSAKPLNGTLTAEVQSYIILTRYNKKLKVACPDCLDKANNEAILTSTLLGWWGIPWGIVRTPLAIYRNLNAKKYNHAEEPNNYLRSYVLARIGLFEAFKNSPEKLQQIISR
jgi:hypothetical protein